MLSDGDCQVREAKTNFFFEVDFLKYRCYINLFSLCLNLFITIAHYLLLRISKPKEPVLNVVIFANISTTI